MKRVAEIDKDLPAASLPGRGAKRKKQVQLDLAKFGLKKCWNCDEVKVLDDFYSSKASWDGLSGHCRICKHAYLMTSKRDSKREIVDQSGLSWAYQPGRRLSYTKVSDGQRFNRLIATGVVYIGRRRLFHCLCDCGETVNARQSELLNGEIKSCGCSKLFGPKNTNLVVPSELINLKREQLRLLRLIKERTK